MTTNEGSHAGVTRRSAYIWIKRKIRHAKRPLWRRLGWLPPGSTYVTCERGHKHWGAFGAAGLLIRSEGYVLLGLRSTEISYPGLWGIPGGARDTADEPYGTAAFREAAEEIKGLDLSLLDCRGDYSSVEHGGWQYRTYVARLLPCRGSDVVIDRPDFVPSDKETTELRWVHLDEVESLPLHPGFAKSWPGIRAAGV